MTSKHVLRVLSGITFVLLWAGLQPPAHAQTLVVTNLNCCLESVDTSTNTITTLLSIGGNPDSVIFSPGNNMVYSLPNQAGIGIFNTVTLDNRYVHGSLVEPVDLTLDPSGNSVLVADSGDGSIKRVNLTTPFPIPSVLSSGFGDVAGLTYDNKGNLFAVINDRSVAQIDPTTGAVLKQIACAQCYTWGPNYLDGMTFDPSTGKLWVAGPVFNGIWEFPTDLSSSTLFASGKIPYPDGIEADGKGNIFVAAKGAQQIFEYNIASQSAVGLTIVPGLDDLAPLTGLGSGGGAPTPEPGTLLLLGTGIVAFGGKVLWKITGC